MQSAAANQTFGCTMISVFFVFVFFFEISIEPAVASCLFKDSFFPNKTEEKCYGYFKLLLCVCRSADAGAALKQAKCKSMLSSFIMHPCNLRAHSVFFSWLASALNVYSYLFIQHVHIFFHSQKQRWDAFDSSLFFYFSHKILSSSLVTSFLFPANSSALALSKCVCFWCICLFPLMSASRSFLFSIFFNPLCVILTRFFVCDFCLFANCERWVTTATRNWCCLCVCMLTTPIVFCSAFSSTYVHTKTRLLSKKSVKKN